MQTKSKLDKKISFESFGVRIGVRANHDEIITEIEQRIKNLLPNGIKRIPYKNIQHYFWIRKNDEGEYFMYLSREKITSGFNRENFFNYLESRIRLTVAEYAKDRVFIHAGVVGWKGKAIIIPAKSFQGKTTLVAELTKLGATYYSDEYAVLDENGFVHPFPKTLSIRGTKDKYKQTEFPVEMLGGVKGEMPLTVGMVLLTEFEADAKWQPKLLTVGLGVMDMLSHTIPIRYNPEFSLKVLNNTLNRAIIVKTKRGEAKHFAIKLLSFFENKAF
jgi:hypothetical protein